MSYLPGRVGSILVDYFKKRVWRYRLGFENIFRNIRQLFFGIRVCVLVVGL